LAEKKSRGTLRNQVSLSVRADDRVPYGAVAKVMAEIEHSGIAKVSVLTDNQ